LAAEVVSPLTSGPSNRRCTTDYRPAGGHGNVETRYGLVVRKQPKFGGGYCGYRIRMAAFYEVSLGLKPIQETRMDTWVEFDTGGSCFSLHAIPATIASQIEVPSPPQPRESSPVKLFFEAEDLEMEVSRLTTLGVPVLQRPWGTFDGIDPEGNIFQITSSSNCG